MEETRIRTWQALSLKLHAPACIMGSVVKNSRALVKPVAFTARWHPVAVLGVPPQLLKTLYTLLTVTCTNTTVNASSTFICNNNVDLPVVIWVITMNGEWATGKMHELLSLCFLSFFGDISSIFFTCMHTCAIPISVSKGDQHESGGTNRKNTFFYNSYVP